MKSYGVIADDKLVVNEKNLFTEKEAIEEKKRLQKIYPESKLKIQVVEASYL